MSGVKNVVSGFCFFVYEVLRRVCMFSRNQSGRKSLVLVNVQGRIKLSKDRRFNVRMLSLRGWAMLGILAHKGSIRAADGRIFSAGHFSSSPRIGSSVRGRFKVVCRYELRCTNKINIVAHSTYPQVESNCTCIFEIVYTSSKAECLKHSRLQKVAHLSNMCDGDRSNRSAENSDREGRPLADYKGTPDFRILGH